MESLTYKTKYGTFRISENDKKMRLELESHGEHQGAEIEWLLNLVPQGGKVLDIGAHVGTFAIPLARKAAVIACEPHPVSFELLKENIARNNVVVEAHHVAVGGSGTLRLATPKNDAGSRLSEHGQYEVRVAPLDDLYDSYDLIKVDVEGSEYEVLRSGSRTLSERPLLFFEVGDNTKLIDRIRIDWLLRGYRFYRWHKHHKEVERIFSSLQISFGDILAVPKERDIDPTAASSHHKNDV